MKTMSENFKLPKCYDTLPVPPGYFAKDPGYRNPKAPSYNLFMMLDYAKSVGKEICDLSGDEVLLFETDEKGQLKRSDELHIFLAQKLAKPPTSATTKTS